MKKIRVLVNGAKGRMGQEVVKAVTTAADLELVDQTDLGDDLIARIKASQSQAVVDFTTAAVAFENTRKILEAGVHPIVGTSGLLAGQVAELQQLAKDKDIGGLIAPNFAIGAVLLMKYVQDAAKYLPDVEVIELHHNRKADAPSGTAVKTAQLIADARQEIPKALVEEKELFEGARGSEVHGVRVHSLRLPGLVAHQEVIFGGTGETLTIRHDSIHRESFMPGVCLACRKVIGTQQLFYGLEHLL
ncbi:MAG: 4-hydroxy-tetrahydrodipicolinate reductase [Deltaproteobacteria bacterium]|nr:4-hydroxy-tetrahydrodipicolinate reductase [Deltaproteobacteria bacterium]